MAAMATVEPSNRPDARPLLAQGGRRFFHKEHGMCELLPKGQWMMQPTKADGEDDKSKRQFPVVYFRVCRRHVPEDVLADAEKWDPDMYDGLKCEPSASIRAMIKNPVMDVALELSLEFEHTVELRFAGYKKHPMFGEVDGYKKLDFAKQLRTTRSDVYIKYLGPSDTTPIPDEKSRYRPRAPTVCVYVMQPWKWPLWRPFPIAPFSVWVAGFQQLLQSVWVVTMSRSQ